MLPLLPLRSGFSVRCLASLLGLALVGVPSTLAQLEPSQLVRDGMVLQRNAQVPIWGWANAGESVTVRFDDRTDTDTAGPSGRWRVVLPAMKAGGPHEMTIRSRSCTSSSPTSTPVPNRSTAPGALLRESQSTALSLPNTAQVVTIDIGNPDNIHPRNKQDVGRRLSLAARALEYGEDLVYSGPVYESHRVKEDRVILRFDHVGSGLVARGAELRGFTIAGPDRQFVRGTAKIEGARVIVSSGQIDTPVAVRYAWADNPERANLYNRDGLPASPFRTDTWPIPTEPTSSQ